MEFTDEQQAFIDKLLEAKTKGMFTEDELNRRVTSEVDRRVESGIQKGLATNKAKWEEEFSERAKLTAEELAEKDINSKMDEINELKLEIAKRENTLNAKELLSNADIPKEQYEKFINILVSDCEESTTSNVENFIDSFNTTKSEIESKLKKELSQISSPTIGESKGGISKEQFEKMDYMERIELKQKDEKLYNELTQ